MAKLLKVDLKRIFKDKLLLVVAIIGVVLGGVLGVVIAFIKELLNDKIAWFYNTHFK